MVMSNYPTTHPPGTDALAIGQRLRLPEKLHRMPLLVAGLALASLLLPLSQAEAAAIEPALQGESIAAQAGLQPVAQQRDGRRGGGEFRGNAAAVAARPVAAADASSVARTATISAPPGPRTARSFARNAASTGAIFVRNAAPISAISARIAGQTAAICARATSPGPSFAPSAGMTAAISR